MKYPLHEILKMIMLPVKGEYSQKNRKQLFTFLTHLKQKHLDFFLFHYE